MTLEMLVICALAAWRVAHLLVNERGPLAIGEHLRTLAGVQQVTVQRPGYNNVPYETTECVASNEVGQMLCCIYCANFWTACLMFALWQTEWRAIVYLCCIWAAGAFAEKANRYV